MITLWCEHAWLGGAAADAGVLLEIVGDRIHSVQSGVERAPDGCLVRYGLTLPGFANAHSHAFHRALRGRTHSGPGSFWTWRNTMYEAAEALNPDTYYQLARAVYGEMLLAGFTSVGEFHYLHHDAGGVPYANPNAMGEALIAAAASAGLRITLLDTCYLHGGIGHELNTVQQRFADQSVAGWANRAAALPEGPMVRVGAAVHSVRACDPTEIAEVARWATETNRPLHAHVSEQPAENAACQAAYGMSPIELFAAAGAISSRFSAVHATHLSPHDITALSGATACFCPTTERDLADGIGPARRLIAAGVHLSIGSDSHAVIDPFEETRAIELNERLATNERGNIDVASLLCAATESGQRSLGWSDAGAIRSGALADLVIVSTSSVRLAGTRVQDLLAAVVYAAHPTDVTDVMVGGRWVVADRHHATLDVAAELTAVLA